MPPLEALYGRKSRSPLCWDDSADAVVLGLELLEETTTQIGVIKQRMLAAHNRQKAYADGKRSNLEFQPGKKVFVKVSPTKGVFRFGK